MNNECCNEAEIPLLRERMPDRDAKRGGKNVPRNARRVTGM